MNRLLQPLSYAPLAGAKSHPGWANKKNEDAYDVFKIGAGGWSEDPKRSIYVAVVADGVTSMTGGARASKIAVRTIRETLIRRKWRPKTLQALHMAIDEAIVQANQKILDVAQKNPAWSQMSTTLVLAALVGGTLKVAHLGDSRAYLIRDRRIFRLTRDHTWVENAIDHKLISATEAKTHPNRNVIQNYLGITGHLEIDHNIMMPANHHNGAGHRYVNTTLSLKMNDAILLCTDGLTDKVSDEEICTVVNRNYQPRQATVELVKLALGKQETDNITAVILSLAQRNKLGNLIGKLKDWIS